MKIQVTILLSGTDVTYVAQWGQNLYEIVSKFSYNLHFYKIFFLERSEVDNLPYPVFIEFLTEQILDWISISPLLNSFVLLLLRHTFNYPNEFN